MTWPAGANKRFSLGQGLHARLVRRPGAAWLEGFWRGLEAIADASVFQGWLWTGNCLAARFNDAVLLVVERGATPVAAGLLNRRRWSGLPCWHLGASGNAAWDGVFIEHNGPLVVRGDEQARAAWYRALLQSGPPAIGAVFDLPGIGDAGRDAVTAAGIVDEVATRAVPWCDLAALRAEGRDCLDQASANTRQQVRRAFRACEASGAMRVSRAADAMEAGRWLDALAVLHQATWQARGRSGAFAVPEFRRFHVELLQRGVADGIADLLQITAGERVIGYLYNLVWRGRVAAYQSGFDYAVAHPHEKPGLVCHVAAMRYYQAAGLGAYDFLGGAARYKTSLANREDRLHWLRTASRWSLCDVALRVAHLRPGH